MPISLVVADDYPIVLTGLTDLFRSVDEFDVLAAAEDGEEALAAVRRHLPDVAVLDIRMPHHTGLEVARTILDEGLPTKIVLLTAEIRDEESLEAIRLGVHGVILKEMATRLLVECVRKVHAGGRWVEQESLRRAVESLLRRPAIPAPGATILSPTEHRIAELVAGGARNKEIADRLTVSESTVKSHLHNIYGKLQITSRSELIEWYEERGRRAPS
jgi:two-component system, NarL family, nitrate/nitrite response regulator NarL